MSGAVRLSLGVPVQRFNVTVQHSTPRIPNPLETALIHIVLRLGGLPHYRERPLAQLFTEMLCIPQPELWLTPMLEELTDIRLLTCERHLDEVGAILLGDLALTERGQKMVNSGKLLGRPQRITLSWCWDPVALEVRSAQAWEGLSWQAPALALRADAYQDIFPIEAFRTDLVNASWYRAGETEIEAVTPAGGPELRWESVIVEAALNGTRLNSTCTRPAVRAYLQEQEDAAITDGLAAAVFGEAYADFDDWEQVVPTGDDKIFPLAHIADLLDNAREVAFDNIALNTFDGIEQASVGGLRVHYSETDEPAEVGSGTDAGHFIVSGRVMPVPDCSIVADGRSWRLCRVAVSIGRTATTVPVALQLRVTQAVANPALAQELLETRDPVQISAALRLDAAKTWPALLHGLRGAHKGKACLDVVLAWITEMLTQDSKSARVLDRKILQDVFAQALREHGPIGMPGEFTTWRIALQALEPPDPRSVLEQLLDAAYPAISIAALHSMTDEARKVVKDYCIPYSPVVYAGPLVSELLALASLDRVERALRNPNPFEHQLRALWKEGAGLARMLGTPLPIAAPPPNALAKILRDRKSEACIAAIRQWRQALDGFYQFARVEAPDPASPLEICRIGLLDWEDQLVRAAANESGQFDHVFVADTNALINLPDLPLKMTGNVLLVLPQTVLDELDRKKRDPALAQACNQAARLLRDMPASRRRYEDSDLTRLPADFEDTPDNRILSVAMKYHHPNLRLITDDSILMTKAENMKITAVKIDRFGGHAARTGASRQADKPGQHKKGRVA